MGVTVLDGGVGVELRARFRSEDTALLPVREPGRVPHARPSMLLDHMAQRRSEIDWINGKICALARPLGLPTPFNEVITAMIRERERAFPT